MRSDIENLKEISNVFHALCQDPEVQRRLTLKQFRELRSKRNAWSTRLCLKTVV
jgi:hypothetical protein